MIVYDKLWTTMNEKGISQYKLVTKYEFSRGQLSRLKHNKNVNTFTLNRLCEILDCGLEDIAEFVKED